MIASIWGDQKVSRIIVIGLTAVLWKLPASHQQLTCCVGRDFVPIRVVIFNRSSGCEQCTER